MKKWSMIAAAIGCAGLLMAANPEDVKLQTVKNAYKKLPAPSKRILVDFEKWSPDLALKTPAGQANKKIILRDAEEIMKLKPCKRVMEGKRLLGVSRQVLVRVNTMAMAWKLTGEAKYARRGIEEMMSAASFSDWNPSHFLDVGEMAIAMAVGYACLYPEMSDLERKAVEDALWEKAVMMSLPENPEAKKRNAGLWWISGKNNWAPVCHSGVIAAALVAGDRDPETAVKVIHRAIVNLPISMRASYSPNGAYPEGPGYWAYGSEFNCLALGLLEHAFGTDFGLSKIPGWSTTGNYISHVTAPTGMSYNYSDGGTGVSADLPWFFLESHYPGSIPLTDSILKKLVDSSNQKSNIRYSKTYQMDELRSNRLRPLELLWLKPQSAVPERPLWYYSGDTSSMPLAMFRSDWSKDAIYLGIKGGGPSAPHAHMDAGSFILEAENVRWVWDLGAESYHPLEARGMDLWNMKAGSDRWKVFRLNSDSHSIIRINGEPQLAKGWSKIVRLQTAKGKPMAAKLELTSLYKDVKSVERIAALGAKGVSVQDTLTGVKAGSKVRFQFCTRAAAEVQGNQVILSEKGKKMYVSVNQKVEWKFASTDQWRREWDSKNGSAKMVWFEIDAPKNGNVNYTVSYIPGKLKK